jgi:hypothetical protein
MYVQRNYHIAGLIDAQCDGTLSKVEYTVCTQYSSEVTSWLPIQTSVTLKYLVVL